MQGAEEARQQGQSAAMKVKRRWRAKASGAMVETQRVAHVLRWIRGLVTYRADLKLCRTQNWRTALSAPTLLLTCDASPWGLGAVLSTVGGFPLAWLASPLTAEDERALGIKIGDCACQTIVEALALLVALRVWAPL